jgi:hypothetical protein
LAVTSIISNVIANPGAELSKRSTKAVHPVNCYAPSGPSAYSIIAYCPNDSTCNHTPSVADECSDLGGATINWVVTSGRRIFSTSVGFRLGLNLGSPQTLWALAG